MPSRFERYRMIDGRTPLGERYFNAIWRDIDLRIATLEEVKIAWSAAVDEVVRFGLTRIDELINEPLQSVLALSSQAESTSADLEQLRQLAEARTAALAALIETLQADTAAQVNAFLGTASGDITEHKAATVEDITAWKAQRTAELETWVADYEARLLAARAEIDAAIAALQASVTELARLRRVRKAASFAPVAADTRSCFVVTAAATITVPAAALLGVGWWCEIINDSAAVVSITGALALELRPGARVRLHADDVAVEVLDLTPSLERRPLWGPHPGRRYVGMGLALRKEVKLPQAVSVLVPLAGVLLGVAANKNYWSTTDGETIVARSFPETPINAKAGFAWTGAKFMSGSSGNSAGQYMHSTDGANWTLATIAGATAAIKVFASNGAGLVMAAASSGSFVYVSQDHGNTWTAQISPWPFAMLVYFKGLWIGTYSSNVYTSPTGQVWTSRGAVGNQVYECKLVNLGQREVLVFTGAASAPVIWTEDGITFNEMDMANVIFGDCGDVMLWADGTAATGPTGMVKREALPISFALSGWIPAKIEKFAGRIFAIRGNSDTKMFVSSDEDYGFFEREAT